MDKSALFKLSYGLYVVGVKNGDSFGGCVVDAFMQATAGDAPSVILACMNGNLTAELIEKYGEFTVSVLVENVDPFVLGNFGFQSSRDADKWANVPHHDMGGLPVLNGCAAYLRCRVTETKPMSTHKIFICSVEDAVTGEGEPLIYGDYHKKLKGAVAAAFNEFKSTGKPPVASQVSAPEASAPAAKEVWVCSVCGYEYDGDVPFEELPEDWKCPLCGQPKSVFTKETR